eukprot:scpid72570/ scgid13622/ Leukotriene-B(4) omega-hydroxylase 1; CYPIVF2; Cytochrome P450 4F2; Cytochrome P450-LTB-omega; Leukotriene-B(4) 20-monooxygenase 1
MVTASLLRISAIGGLSLLTVLLAKLLHTTVHWWLRCRQLKRLVPEPAKSHWLRGHQPPAGPHAKSTYISYTRTCPRMFFYLAGPVAETVCAHHPDVISEVLQLDPPKIELFGNLFRTWLGDGLLSLTGKRYDRAHKMIATGFNPEMRRQYVGVFKEAASVMLDLWEEHGIGRSIEMGGYFNMLTFDMVLRCTMGAETNCQTHTDPDVPVLRYSNALHDIITLTFQRFTQPWLYLDFVFLNSPAGWRFKKLLTQTRPFAEQLINERRALMKEKSESNGITADFDEHPHDMLDILLTSTDEQSMNLSNADIMAHVETLLAVGHHTTSYTLHWAMHYLSQHQHVQERCRQEVHTVLEACGGIDELASQHLTKLVYLNQTLLEILRVTVTGGNLSREFPNGCTVDGITFPAGTRFLVNVLGLHHNEQVWTDPETFDPDRFAPGAQPRSRFAFLPFGYGRHMCIGKSFTMDEMKVTLSMILARFRLMPDPDATLPVWKESIVAQPDPDVRILLETV